MINAVLRLQPGDSIEWAIRRFRNICDKAGLHKAMARHDHFMQPSERRRRKKKKAALKYRNKKSREY